MQWNCPPTWWYKCNTDGASRGNPGLSATAYYIRDDRGDLFYESARRLSDTTNIHVEALAIVDGLEYYVKEQLLPVVIEID
ncbi:hypothetical protein RND71_015671 [Anisodus tanguticus]|uniref:RNase H type-1 domain-containing protein n=1 Tax=Anisodus tanguticus TaxID=243964 RepID=A0AAE1VC12_9SOLA|nr:hypothetical protein RND71_015671 [Anisodus tanguticus]